MATHPLETVSGLVTSWLPLTTGLSAPPECYSAIYSQQGSAGQLIAFDPFFQRIIDPSFTTCLPSQASLWYNQNLNTIGTVTSLGPFECPGGYSTAFTTEESTSTQIACCPSGYAYQGSIVDHGTIGECWSTPKVGATIRYFTVTDSGPWSETSTVLGTTHVVGVQVNGWNIASKTTSSNSASSTPSTSPSPSDKTSAQPGGSSTSNYLPTSPPISNTGTSFSSGLSSGSKAALGVGIALAVIGIGALGFAFFLFRRQRQMKNIPLAPTAPIDGRAFWGGQVYDPKEIDTTTRGVELTSQTGPYYEIGGNYRAA